jgi:DNA-binding PadR family transcriptional regulator
VSDSCLSILASLAGGPKHGYVIMTDVNRFSSMSLEPGTLYAALARLEHRGWVESQPEPTLLKATHRRRYGLTGAGQRALREHLKPLNRAAVGQHRPAVV